jgi:Mrp family chromosome partitioning ATPase
LADGLVLVIEANITRRETAQKIKQDLELVGVCLVGAVLNNRTFPIPDSLYRHLQTTVRF